jgi:TP901 family phage tail tape measure protein
MAIESEAKIIISAVDKYSDTFGDLNSGFGTLTKTAMLASTAVATFSVGMAALTVKMGSSAVQSAADFRDAIFDVSAVVGNAGASTGQISTILDDLVQKFPVTGAQAGKALESIAQFGFGAEEQLKNISDAAVGLQIATGTDLNTTVSALTATLNQFGLEASETARVSNVLAAAQFNSAASVSDLREGLKFAGPIAKLFNKDLESTVGVLSLLRDSGLAAEQSGTLLRGAMVALSKETEKGTSALAKYGLTYADVNPATKSYVEILKSFNGATIEGSDAIAIFGTEASSFASIINKGSDSLSKRIGQVTATSSAEDAAAEKSKKWSVVLDNLGGTLDVFKKTIAEGLLPVIIDFIGSDENSGIRGVIDQLLKLEKSSGSIGGPLIDAFNALRDATKDVFDNSFQGNIENVYDWLSNISKALSENIKIIINLGAEFAKLFIDSTTGAEKLQALLKVANVAITAIALSVAVVRDSFTGLYLIATDGATELNVIINELDKSLAEFGLAVLEAIDRIPFVDLSKSITEVKENIKLYQKEIDAGNAKLSDSKPAELWSKSVLEASAKNIESIEELGVKAKDTVESIPDINLGIDGDQAVSDMTDIANEIVDIQGKASEDVTKKEKEEQEKRLDEAKKTKEERKIILDERLKDIETTLHQEEQLYVESISKIDLAEAEGEKSGEEAIKEKLKLEEKYLKEKISLTEEAYDNIKKVYPEDVQKQKDAFDDVKNAQLEFTNFKIRKIEDEREALKNSLDSEIGIYQANSEAKRIEVEKAENAGVISATEAANQKRAIEEEFLQFSIGKLQEKIDLAAGEYGRDSEEYATAVLSKKQAELELQEAQKQTAESTREVAEATQQAGSAAEVASGINAAFNDRMQHTTGTLNDFLKELQDTRKFMDTFGKGAFELVQIDEGTQSLRDLTNVAVNARAALSSLAGSKFEGIASFEAKEDIAKIEELEKQFQAVADSAAEAGLKVDVMDQTLSEAGDDVAERIEGWTNFKDTLGELSTNISSLTNEYTNLDSSLGSDGISKAAEDFNTVANSAKDLSEQIKDVNNEFGTGNIEAAEEMADGVIDAYEDIYDQAVDILDDLKSEWETLADEIVKTNEKITDIQQTTEDKIREARRETMDELGQFQDIRLEYDEVYADAQEALSQKQFDKASELFEKAADIAEELQQEVKDGSGEVVSSLEENTTLSINLMQKASDAAVEALNNQNSSLLSQQSTIQSQISQTTDTIGQLGNQINESFQGIDKASKDFSNLGNSIKGLSNRTFNFDFTGTGSSKKPLSEKIAEMEGKLFGFEKKTDSINPRINSDFTNISGDIRSVSNEIDRLNSTSGLGLGALNGAGITEPSGRTGRDWRRGFQSGTADFSGLIDSQNNLVNAIQKFSFPEQFKFNVSVQSNGNDWLKGLTKSIINEIFIQAEAEQFNAFGQEG